MSEKKALSEAKKLKNETDKMRSNFPTLPESEFLVEDWHFKLFNGSLRNGHMFVTPNFICIKVRTVGSNELAKLIAFR
jgi:hypothetical protein